jgi:N-acyl-D-amino-acid deacylase
VSCAKRFDLVLKGGQIYDGSGGESFVADIGIKGDRITAIGELGESGTKMIDAAGLYIAPGFIDVHNHAVFSEDEDEEFAPGIELDFDELRRVKNYLYQGVATIVSGNCGAGPHNVGDMYARMREEGIGLNVIELVGHGTIRDAVMGQDDRDPTAEELDQMKQMVAEAMEGGAVGLSTGLFYAPGSYAKTEEVIELARVVQQYGGIYASHVRDEGANDMGGVLAAMKEAVRIGEEAGVPVQIAHLKAAGPRAWGKAEEITRVFEDARNRGVQVYADQYPYPAGSTSISAIVLPRWVQADGRMLERFEDASIIDKVKADMMERIERFNGPEAIVITYFDKNRDLEGKNLKQISEEMGLNHVDAAIEILKTGDPAVVIFMMREEDVEYFMTKPYVMTSSDGLNVPFGFGLPHPRNYGAFTRKIRKYVLEEDVLSMEAAIRAATSLPAEMLGLKDRGLLKEGYAADIVAFNPETIRDRATFTEPHQYSEGIEFLLINGALAIEGGEYTGALAGRPLRHTR